MLALNETSKTFNFVNVSHPPVASLFRGFSAPVKVEYDRNEEDLYFLLHHDSDDVNRWDAFQSLVNKCVSRQLTPTLRSVF